MGNLGKALQFPASGRPATDCDYRPRLNSPHLFVNRGLNSRVLG